MSARPIYLAAPVGAVRDRCVAHLRDAEVVDAPGRLEALAAEPPGVVLVDPAATDAHELMAAAAALRASEGWTVCAVGEGQGASVEVRTVSVGHRHTLDDVARFAGVEPRAGDLLELHGVLAEVARARHDLNNPLTSALAEVQILLMDASGDAAEESLLVIQEQLRRMRDRLLATRHLRPASAPGAGPRS